MGIGLGMSTKYETIGTEEGGKNETNWIDFFICLLLKVKRLTYLSIIIGLFCVWVRIFAFIWYAIYAPWVNFGAALPYYLDVSISGFVYTVHLSLTWLFFNWKFRDMFKYWWTTTGEENPTTAILSTRKILKTIFISICCVATLLSMANNLVWVALYSTSLAGLWGPAWFGSIYIGPSAVGNALTIRNWFLVFVIVLISIIEFLSKALLLGYYLLVVINYWTAFFGKFHEIEMKEHITVSGKLGDTKSLDDNDPKVKQVKLTYNTY